MSALGVRLYQEHLDAEAAGRPEIALAKLKHSARLGEPMAKHAIAYGLAKDDATDAAATRTSLRLYREAANSGFAPSAWNLARHYERTGNRRTYFKWLRRAAEIGDEDARDELSDPAPYMLQRGIDAYESGARDEGRLLVRRAATWGNCEAPQQLARWRDAEASIVRR